MDKYYIDDYNKLLALLKDKLNSNCIQPEYTKIYLNYVNAISNTINANSTSDDYEVAINKLYAILEEIKPLDHSLASNYHIINTANETANFQDDMALTEFIDEISNNVNSFYIEKYHNVNREIIINKLKQLNNNLKSLSRSMHIARMKLVAYILALSVLISAPIGILIGTKKKTEDKTLYLTEKVIYDSENVLEYDVNDNNGMMAVSNVLTYKIDYQELVDVGINGYIAKENGDYGYNNCYYELIEKTPWIKTGREAYRTVRTCHVAASDLGNVINLNDYDMLFNTYDGVVEKEIVYANEIPRADHIFYSKEENKDKKTYEVIRYNQDLNTSITMKMDTDYTNLYIFLLGELFVWLCIVESTDGLLTEGIIKSIGIVMENKKLSKIQQTRLDKLYKLYVNKYRNSNQKKKIKNKNK